MSEPSRGLQDAVEPPEEASTGATIERTHPLTEAEQERTMAALDSVKAGRVKPATDVRRRVEAMLKR